MNMPAENSSRWVIRLLLIAAVVTLVVVLVQGLVKPEVEGPCRDVRLAKRVPTSQPACEAPNESPLPAIGAGLIASVIMFVVTRPLTQRAQ